jgi:cyclase
VERRDFLRTAVTGALVLSAGSRALHAQAAGSIRNVTPRLSVINVGGNNVLCLRAVPSDRFVLVDCGAPNSRDQLQASLKTFVGGAKLEILFNTHYHVDQTGNNELFAAAGARIIAHEHTRQWMSTDYWLPDEDRYERARPKAAHPTEFFRTTGSLQVGTANYPEMIDYGHLPLAHTDGDIYVFFKTANVLAVGDVAAGLRDPALDWLTGAWIGGRVDAMDTILKLSNDDTHIVPASGPVMNRAEFKEERDMMEEVRSRIWKRTLQGDSPREMLEAGVLNGLLRTWKDPYKFLYDAAKGMFAHHNKLDPAVI